MQLRFSNLFTEDEFVLKNSDGFTIPAIGARVIVHWPNFYRLALLPLDQSTTKVMGTVKDVIYDYTINECRIFLKHVGKVD